MRFANNRKQISEFLRVHPAANSQWRFTGNGIRLLHPKEKVTEALHAKPSFIVRLLVARWREKLMENFASTRLIAVRNGILFLKGRLIDPCLAQLVEGCSAIDCIPAFPLCNSVQQ